MDIQELLYVSDGMWIIANNYLTILYVVCWTSILTALSSFLISELWISQVWYVNYVTQKLPHFEKTWYIYWEGDLVWFHLLCLSFKISHHFTGIITLIYFSEWEPKLHTDRSDQKPLLHWLGLCASWRKSECHVSSWELKYCRTVLQTKHTSNSPSTGKTEASTINSRAPCVFFSKFRRKNQNNKTKTKLNNPSHHNTPSN